MWSGRSSHSCRTFRRRSRVPPCALHRFFETLARPVPSNSTEAFLIAVDVRRFSWIRRLAADYAFNFDSLASFFAGNPTERSAWTDAIARTRACPRRHADIAAVVARQQARRGAPPRAQAAGRLLGSPG